MYRRDMKRGFSITKNSTLWLGLGVVLVAVSWWLFFSNVKLSIEFTGGVQVHTTNEIEQSAVEGALTTMATDNSWKLEDVSTSVSENGTDLLLKMQLDDSQVAAALDAVKETLVTSQAIADEGQIDSLTFIGPSIGDYIKKSAVWALGIGIVLMAVYMMLSFGDARKVIPPYTLASITIITMIFDASIPAGMYGIWMAIDPTIQVNSIFIIAILTTIGYSINDTIIILDRIKENAMADEKSIVSGKHQVADLIDASIWQTMRRSLGTSFSTLVVVIAMFVIGDGVIKQFAYVIGWGIIAGTFSSIFISATSLHVLTRKHK
ncbi:MAG: hypothetical protein H6766_04125 [Candidatus Peribacteria bacterium]|nr:MAG: hypothetical protein H6766_04125 [Candidatus Peribacteria bacterium]